MSSRTKAATTAPWAPARADTGTWWTALYLARGAVVDQAAAEDDGARGVQQGQVHQAGNQPALGGQLGAGDRIVGPPVNVGKQVDRIATGEGDAADPENGHRFTLFPRPRAGQGQGTHMSRVARGSRLTGAGRGNHDPFHR
jgi:hypothetical protein